MKLEQQVCSLEPAKRLKELGVKQESLFYYQGSIDEFARGSGYVLDYGRPLTRLSSISAFTVAELGEMYGDVMLATADGGEVLMSAKYDGRWRCGVRHGKGKGKPALFSAATEADVRAQTLIYLLWKNLIKLARKE